jgi:hypothetical protein
MFGFPATFSWLRRNSNSCRRSPRGGSTFSASPFYSRIAQVYGEGAGIVLAADLEKIIAHTRGVRRIAVGDQHENALSQLGVFNMKSFVLDQKDT